VFGSVCLASGNPVGDPTRWGAAIGEWVGLRATILTGSGLVLLAALILLTSPVRAVHHLGSVEAIS